MEPGKEEEIRKAKEATKAPPMAAAAKAAAADGQTPKGEGAAESPTAGQQTPTEAGGPAVQSYSRRPVRSRYAADPNMKVTSGGDAAAAKPPLPQLGGFTPPGSATTGGSTSFFMPSGVTPQSADGSAAAHNFFIPAKAPAPAISQVDSFITPPMVSALAGSSVTDDATSKPTPDLSNPSPAWPEAQHAVTADGQPPTGSPTAVTAAADGGAAKHEPVALGVAAPGGDGTAGAAAAHVQAFGTATSAATAGQTQHYPGASDDAIVGDYDPAAGAGDDDASAAAAGGAALTVGEEQLYDAAATASVLGWDGMLSTVMSAAQVLEDATVSSYADNFKQWGDYMMQVSGRCELGSTLVGRPTGLVLSAGLPCRSAPAGAAAARLSAENCCDAWRGVRTGAACSEGDDALLTAV